MIDRKQRVRHKVKKVSDRKRLTVFRSNNHIYAQLIDDFSGVSFALSGFGGFTLYGLKRGIFELK